MAVSANATAATALTHSLVSMARAPSSGTRGPERETDRRDLDRAHHDTAWGIGTLVKAERAGSGAREALGFMP